MRAGIADHAKALIKELVYAYFNRHTPCGDDIAILTSRRSGGTLLMEAIGANRGVRFMDQPFGVYSGTITQIRQLPICRSGELVSMDTREEEQVREYVGSLLNGTFAVNAPWKIWDRYYDFASNRIVLKITRAKCVAQWLSDTFPLSIIFLIRHPIPQALSTMNLRWELVQSAYLDNERFVSQNLSHEQFVLCREVSRSGTEFDKYVLDWALENLVPLKLVSERKDWLFLSYEDMVINRDAVVEGLSGSLHLPESERMIRVLGRPSRSTKHSSTPRSRLRIGAGEDEYLIERWRNQVSNDQVTRAFEILEALGIEVYRAENAMSCWAARFPSGSRGARGQSGEAR